MSEFYQKNVLITGAAHGIGKLMAGMVADLGGNLIISDVNAAGLEATAAELRRKGVKVFPYAFDISDREAVYATAERIKQEVGQVDILINNAGIVFTGEILSLPDDKHRKQVEVNLMGTLWMLKAFVPDMVKRNDGHIVNVASSAGMLAIPGMGIYSATKHALMGLNEALRHELYNCGAKNIKVTVVCPYMIKTGMFAGMKTPFYQPPLTPEALAKGVIQGVLKNRYVVGKPFTVFLPPIIKALFPPIVMDTLLRISGLNKSVYYCEGFHK